MNYNKAMKNIIDYIKEYGNLTLEEYPFNNVDSLILSQISYIKFENSSIDIESEVHLLSDFENEIDTLCGSLTLAHSRNSQMSFMYGFFFVKFLFFTVVCVVIVI